MTAAPLKPARSIFRNLIAALTLGPAALVIIIGLWSSYDIARSIRAELINQINDDVAALTECLVDAARTGLDLADAQVLARYDRWRWRVNHQHVVSLLIRGQRPEPFYLWHIQSGRDRADQIGGHRVCQRRYSLQRDLPRHRR